MFTAMIFFIYLYLCSYSKEGSKNFRKILNISTHKLKQNLEPSHENVQKLSEYINKTKNTKNIETQTVAVKPQIASAHLSGNLSGN
jgi:predicted RNA-binding protein